MVLAINITMNTLEIMMVERQSHEDLKVTRTGLQPFSISPESPGFQLLVQWLLTRKSDLGFVMTHLPAFSKLGSCSFAVKDLIKQGSAHQGSGSWVFAATVASDADAILKLNTAPTEVSRHIARFKFQHHTAVFADCRHSLAYLYVDTIPLQHTL